MRPSSESTTHIWRYGNHRPSCWRLGGILAVSALALLGAQRAQAATIYWDLNGTTANAATAVSGTWNGTNVFWNTASSGTGGTPQAGTTAADDLIFSSGAVYTAGTITLSGARVASSISFEDNINVTLSGGTSLTIGGTGAAAFDGVRVLAGNNSANAISTALILATGANTIQNAGTGALTISGGITGAQNLILQNNSTNAAGITISTASLNNTGTLTNSGTGSGGVTVSSVIGTNVTGVTQNSATSTLTLSGTNTYTGVTTLTSGVLSVGTIGNGGVAGNLGAATNAAANLVLGGGTLQYTGATASTNRNFTLTAGTTSSIEVVNAATNLTISGASTNTTGALTKIGAGTLTLSGANLYTGLTTVSNGTLAYGVNNALSSGAVTVSGGTLDIKTFSDTVGAVTLSSGSINGTTGVLTGTSYSLTNTGSVSAILAGAVTLTKTGAGTATLSGANTYTGLTTVTTGALNIQNATALGPATGTAATATTVAAAGELQLQGGITVANELLTLTPGAVGGTLRNVSSNNSWNADITMGIAAVGASNVNLISDSGLLTVGNILETALDATIKDLVVGGSGDVTVTGLIHDSRSGSASGPANTNLIKNGSGTLTITGANNSIGTSAATSTINGTITINGGTVDVSGATGSLASSAGPITINTGGTLLLSGNAGQDQLNNTAPITLAGGTLKLGANGTNETVGVLSMTTSSIIDFAALTGTNNLIFANSSAASWTGTLSIWNWTSGTDHIYFGTVANAGLTAAQQAQISFYSDSGSDFLGHAKFGPANGEESPAVPEPSAVLVGLSLLSLAAWRERKWLLRTRDARRIGIV